MKREINVFDYAGEILSGMKKGALVTSKANGKVNPMTISWGTLGIEWGQPIFTTFIRENRFTKTLIDESGEFTVSIPYGEYDKKILGICGTKSGHDVDKVELLNLTLVEGDEVSVPAIKEIALTLECKVVYVQEQDKHAIAKEFLPTFYPQGVESQYHGANKDFHTAYYGQIVKAYIIE